MILHGQGQQERGQLSGPNGYTFSVSKAMSIRLFSLLLFFLSFDSIFQPLVCFFFFVMLGLAAFERIPPNRLHSSTSCGLYLFTDVLGLQPSLWTPSRI